MLENGKPNVNCFLFDNRFCKCYNNLGNTKHKIYNF